MAGFYTGTDLKFKIDIKADGFDMEYDDFCVALKYGNGIIEVPKENIVNDGEGNYYMLVDTSNFRGCGLVSMIVTAYVPDEDFPTGIRREVAKIDLCVIKNV